MTLIEMEELLEYYKRQMRELLLEEIINVEEMDEILGDVKGLQRQIFWYDE